MPYHCASEKSLLEVKDIGNIKLLRKIWKTPSRSVVEGLLEENAAELGNTIEWIKSCYNRPTLAAIKKAAVNELGRFSGVEYIGLYAVRGPLYLHRVYHCNAGDEYAPTVVMIGDNLTVQCLADLAERIKQEEML